MPYGPRPICLCKYDPANPFRDHDANGCTFVFRWESEEEMNRGRSLLNGWA